MITKLELKRQLTHIMIGVSMVTLLYFNLLNAWFILAACAVIVFASYATYKGYEVYLFDQFLRLLGRKEENARFPAKGLIFYLLGCGFVVLLFQKDIAFGSIMILAFGDSVSRLVGPYGYLKHPFNNKKVIEGIIAGAIAAMIAAMLFVPFYYAMFAAFVAMMIEGLDIEINNWKMDDNLSIPLLSAATMTAMQILITNHIIF